MELCNKFMCDASQTTLGKLIIVSYNTEKDKT